MKLETNSKIDAKKYPATYNWDQSYRDNFSFYQNKIDQITYALQRSQRGFGIFGSLGYPNFHQKNLLKLQIYKQKQILGEITKAEVDSYLPINENIAFDLQHTFSNSYRIPTKGLCVGAFTFPIAHYLNLQYSFRAGLFILPVLANIMQNSMNVESYFKVQEFMDFVYQGRKAKSALEMDEISTDAFKIYKEMYNDSKPVIERFQQLIDLVKTEQ